MATGLSDILATTRLLYHWSSRTACSTPTASSSSPTSASTRRHPYWVPEFVGDTIVVNGKVWPYLNVDQQRYRFYIINGSNSRPYDMFIQDQATGITGTTYVGHRHRRRLPGQAGPDRPERHGAQKKAGVTKSLMMMPGERYEIIVDFNDPAWKAPSMPHEGAVFPTGTCILRNTAATVDGQPEGQPRRPDHAVPRLRNVAPVDTSYNPASGIALRPPMVRLPAGQPGYRQLTAGVERTTRPASSP